MFLIQCNVRTLRMPRDPLEDFETPPDITGILE